MKASIVIALLAVTSIFCTGCAKSADKKSNVVVAEAAEAAQLDPAEQKVVVDELPDKSEFEKIPDEAVESFNSATRKLSTYVPVEKKAKRLYGYVGIENLEGQDCCVFCVYDKKKKETLYVGKAACGLEGEELYLDTGAGYELVEIDETPSWAETVTDTYADNALEL